MADCVEVVAESVPVTKTCKLDEGAGEPVLACTEEDKVKENGVGDEAKHCSTEVTSEESNGLAAKRKADTEDAEKAEAEDETKKPKLVETEAVAETEATETATAPVTETAAEAEPATEKPAAEETPEPEPTETKEPEKEEVAETKEVAETVTEEKTESAPVTETAAE